MSTSAQQKIQSRHPLAFVERNINASVGEVWPIIGAIGAEKLYIPSVLKSAIVEGSGHGVGSRRKVVTDIGTVFERVVVYDTDRYILAYEVEEGGDYPVPGKSMAGIVQLEPRGEAVTHVMWSTYFEEMDPAIEEKIRTDSNEMFKGALEGVAKLAES